MDQALKAIEEQRSSRTFTLTLTEWERKEIEQWCSLVARAYLEQKGNFRFMTEAEKDKFEKWKALSDKLTALAPTD